MSRPCIAATPARIASLHVLVLRVSPPSLELVGHLVDAGLDAGFVLVAAGSAGDANRTDDVLADHDRQRTTRGGEAGEILGTHLRILLQPVFHLAGRNPEGARGVSLLEAVLHGVRPGAVATDLNYHFAVAADHGGRHAITVRRAGGDGGFGDGEGRARGQVLAGEE